MKISARRVGSCRPAGALARAHRRQIRARLRFGQIHGAGPFAGDHLRQVALLLLRRAAKLDRLDGALRQERAEVEGHVRRVPHLFDRGRHELRQALPAVLRILGEPVPAVGAILRIRFLESGRRPDSAILEHARAFAVAARVQRIEHLGGEFRRFLEDRRDRLGRGFLEAGQLAHLFEPGQLVHDEKHFLQWGVVLAHRLVNRARRSIGGRFRTGRRPARNPRSGKSARRGPC